MQVCWNLKMNKLIISPEVQEDGHLKYTVQDSNRIYMITRDRALAEKTAAALKSEYNREKQNASKV